MRDKAALQQYYRDIGKLGGIPKGAPAKDIKAKKRGVKRRHTRKVKAAAALHQGGICFCYGVSPVCTQRIEDPHEIISRGAGGPVSEANTVDVCRACHNAAQGRVGGNQLVFHWIGEADGALPQAHVPGNVWCNWVGHRKALGDGRQGQPIPTGRPTTPEAGLRTPAPAAT